MAQFGNDREFDIFSLAAIILTEAGTKNVPVRVPFSKATMCKLCRQIMCRCFVNGSPSNFIVFSAVLIIGKRHFLPFRNW